LEYLRLRLLLPWRGFALTLVFALRAAVSDLFFVFFFSG